jgi:hypothetical protein
MAKSYLVIRIHPDSPVDSGSFGSYLDGLQIQVYQADAPQTAANLLGQIPATAGLTYTDVTLTPIPWGLGYVLSVSKTVTADTAPSSSNFGKTLQLSSIAGIPFGASVTTNSDKPPFSPNTTVTNVSPPSSITLNNLNNPISKFIAAETSVTFYFQYNSLTPDPSFESFSFSLKTSAAASSSKTVHFSNTQGIAVGMHATAPGIPANTTVTAVSSGIVTLLNAVNLAKDDSVKFSLNLNSGIVQHVEQLGFNTIIGNVFVPIPASVATAVVPLNSNPPANSYLDIALVVVRTVKGKTLPIPVQGNFYNVFYKTDSQLPTPDKYQGIPPEDTSLYLTLHAPPINNNPVALTIPTDGTAPAFLELVTAMQEALNNDPAYFPARTDITKLTSDQCTRLAYDIVWSLQNQLPLPPDPLEDLYTNPPNSGGSGNGGDEQDRQKFEGAVSSFYSTRNATAVRLAKFVAAASGALYCENKSVNASQALLEFPVDPAQLPEPSPVESEVLLTGLSSSGVNFGVPAGFFYALGASLDKSTSGDSRYTIACGDTTERALQQIGQAVLAESIGQPGADSEGFYLPLATPPNPQNPITAAQAVRRLSALNVTSSVSTSPVVVLPASGPLTNVVSAWLAATPGQLPTYQSYQSTDADIIWGLIVLNPTPAALAPFAPNFTFTQQPTEEGFLLLVLGALTQGYLIPGSSPPVPLANKIDAFLSGPTISALKAVTPAQWETFFNANPSFIPTCVQPNIAGTPSQPGYIAACVKLFVRAIQQFFTVSSVAGPLSLPSPESAPLFDPLPFDAISKAVANLPLGFQFGVNPLSDSDLNTAVSGVFSPGANAEAVQWLKQSLTAINDLFIIASTVPEITPKDQPVAGNLAFSVMEALYARGFRSAKDIAAISPDAFQRAMIGTVAYQFAIAPSSILYLAAQKIAQTSPVTPPEPGKFHPINPDGTLTNCVPPSCLSPLGPIEYLHEILNLRPDSTCENLDGGQPARESATITSAIASRRGSLGNLLASCANLETPLPLIDIVNECLENAAATAPTTVTGAVYDTADKELDGYILCKPDADEIGCYSARELFATMPQWSSPASPVAKPAAYTNLANDFTACCLPYSQPLDISRSYQRLLCANRSDTMRTFRKQITEFVLAPDSPPTGFQDYLWRYPVQRDIGVEYLGFTPQEFATLFAGTATVAPWQLYGFASELDGRLQWTSVVSKVSEFLDRTCLTYCEFLELQQCGFVSFRNADRNSKDGSFPECEPCCLDNLRINFGEENPTADLTKLAIFIRLWRTLKKHPCGGYSFAQLADVCAVLGPLTGGPLTAEFIRQLAALQMLRHHFDLPLTDPEVKPSGTGVDRTQLLVLWAVPTAANTAIWHWAVSKLIDSIPRLAAARHHTPRRGPEIIKLLAGNLDAISRLPGFNPDMTTDSWHARPTCTLRFAEILVKIYASEFSVGDLLYLITAQHHVDGEDIFPLQTANEALDLPLGLPEDQHSYSLMALRRKLLCAEVKEDAHRHWTWHRISTSLRNEFGYATDPSAADPDPFLTLGKHLFPGILAAAGVPVSVKDTRYYYAKPVPTPALMWNVPPDGPFQCDPGPSPGTVLMWTQAPLRDEAVIDKLSHVHNLDTDEQTAIQDLYFQPRLALAPFAFLFPDFTQADRHLIQEPEERKRWEYFTHHFALTHTRCKIIAEHLARHVHHVTREHGREHEFEAAWLILRDLFADENAAVPPSTWEDPSGHLPTLTWNQLPGAGAFAALLGLTGTGLMGEFSTAGGQVIWREIRGPLAAFGDVRNDYNAPVPTIIPALDFGASTGAGSKTATATASASGVLSTSTVASGAIGTLSALSREVSTYKQQDDQLRFVSPYNGFASRDRDGSELGGAQGFSVRWSGVLLIDNDGHYEFQGGAIGEEQRDPDENHRSWRVVLQRGQRTWLLLNNCWPDDDREPAAALNLKRGAYELCIEFRQSAPDFSRIEDVRRQYTGFRLAYRGPDSDDRWTALPLDRLFLSEKKGTLWDGIKTTVAPSCEAFLKVLYTSSLRDMRRTYQRAFKALLLVERFNLSAKPAADGHSELGYMLANGSLFAGTGFARASSTSFTTNLADFNFNFLPLRDDYLPPTQTDDSRVKPSPQRISALFDWWERLFDYTQVRREAREQHERPLWLLFDEAKSKQPAHPAFLLRHLGIDSRHSNLLLDYYVRPAPGSLYAITAADLQDDRWVVRIWRGEEWIRRMLRCFCPSDITQAQPALWVADDPSVPVPPGTVSGNQNLTELVDDGFLRVEPRRYGEIKELNDGLREHAREALIAYLCRMNRVLLVDGSGGFAQTAGDLSDYFLLDVRAGICERASRIDEAITAVQNFIRRARLGLEPGWTVTHEFERMWDRRFATVRTWQACKRRELYQENYIEWEEMERARRIEAFRFLETKLQTAALTIAEAGGGEWWPDERPRGHSGLMPLQQQEVSWLQQVPAAVPTPEGFTVLGTPESDARPSWLTIASTATQTTTDDTSTTAHTGAGKLAVMAAEAALPGNLPFWLQSAIRLRTQFVRVAAAGWPEASAWYEPYADKDHRGCCAECGCVHPPLVDEYYFWLIKAEQFDTTVIGPDSGYQSGIQDANYDQTQQQSIAWNDPSQVPSLLNWPATPAVRLAWCRVHNGEFRQPRKSATLVEVSSSPSLQFIGRGADSLFFAVTGAAPPPTGYKDPSPAGFRYDLPSDDAVALPLPVEATANPQSYPGALPAYPFFVLDTPGAPLFPESIFAPAVAVGEALRLRCRFDLALKWYELAFAPLKQDCTWITCQAQDTTTVTAGAPAAVAVPGPSAVATGNDTPIGACCDSTAVSRDVVRDRAITLHYCQTLFDWGVHLMRRWPSPEAFQQSRLLFDTAARILGKHPRTILLEPPATPQQVSSFKPATPPLNPRLLELYDHTADRLRLIHACVDAQRLHNGRLELDTSYFGDNPLRHGWRTSVDGCAEENEWCLRQSPYRFTFLVQKALELAAGVREFGAALLSAYEKGDAEYLALLRAEHERELLTLGLAVRQSQWRDADWQIQALQQTKDLNQTNLTYFTNLYQNGLINDEIQYEVLANTAMQTRTSANIVEAEGEVMKVIPDLFIGFPCNDAQMPIGTKLAGVFETIGRVMSIFADIQSSTSQLDLNLAAWDRRSDDWLHQTQTLPIEIEQIEMQILGAQRRRDQALIELNNQQRQIEQSAEILDFLRDKFTNDQLYLYLQKETASLHRKMYDLALHAARQAEHAFNFERGHTTRRFIPDCGWDTLHEGLLAGERLEYALHHMEKAYCDENVREHELTKHISLRLQFPGAYLRLRTTGMCEIEIPEWMFDLDYPGHYMRRIKNIALTLPCVTGPYTGVHCRMTLLSSVTRIDPSLRPSATHCCRDRRKGSDYEACPDDPRMMRQYAARESIATSTGKNDSGMFDLNFRDDPRYFPFEYLGAVCRLRLELPPENNYFDLESLNDAIIHLNYTSRDGGPLLRQAASEVAQRHLPGDGWCFFDIRSDFPDAWQLFRDSAREGGGKRRLDFAFRRSLFPYIPRRPELFVSYMVLVYEAEDGGSGRTGCTHVEFAIDNEDRRHEKCAEFRCVPADKWPDLYHGSVRTWLGPLNDAHGSKRVQFHFSADSGPIRRVFLFCRYHSLVAGLEHEAEEAIKS